MAGAFGGNMWLYQYATHHDADRDARVLAIHHVGRFGDERRHRLHLIGGRQGPAVAPGAGSFHHQRGVGRQPAREIEGGV